MKKCLPAWLAAVVTVLLLAGALAFGGLLLGEKSSEEGRQMLEKTIRRAAVQCYALEGFYPESEDYLQRYYGVKLQPGLYFVDYRFAGSNLMPDVTVLAAQ